MKNKEKQENSDFQVSNKEKQKKTMTNEEHISKHHEK